MLLQRVLHDRLFNSHDRTFGDRRCGVAAARRTDQTVLTEEVTFAVDCEHGFLAAAGQDGHLDLAAQDVEHAIGGIALDDIDLVRTVSRYRPTPPSVATNNRGSNTVAPPLFPDGSRIASYSEGKG